MRSPFDPLNRWQEEHPDGFEASCDISVPLRGGLLMLGADTRRVDPGSMGASLHTQFTGQELEIDIALANQAEVSGLLVAIYEVETPGFSRIHATSNLNGDAAFSVGQDTSMSSLPGGGRETVFGTIDDMAIFALGHTAFECFHRRK